MNYLIDLTEEDIRYVCSAIPYQETTSYFKRYPKEFAKLRPGFRVKSLTKEMVFRTLYEFRTRDFVSSYLIKHIDRWIKEIDEELAKAKEEGLNQDAAYINVLSHSYFAENVALFFKIKEEEKSEDYLKVLSSAVSFEAGYRNKEKEELHSIKNQIKVLSENKKELEQQVADEQKKAEEFNRCKKELKEKLEQSSCLLEEEQEKYKKARERAEKYEAELKKTKEDEIWKTSEMQQKIEALTKRIDEQSVLAEEYLANLSELKSKLASAEEDIQTWKNQVRNREKQIFTFKAERATLLTEKDADKKQIKALKEALEQELIKENKYKEQLASVRTEMKAQATEAEIMKTTDDQEDINIAVKTISKRYHDSERYMPMCPENMDDFDEYFCYNLENIGFDQSEDGSVDFLCYLEKVFFQGVPVLIKRGPGINLANSLSNTLYGVPIAARLLFSEGANIQIIDKFLTETPDRVVCLDGFVGNCNVMELIPVLEQHRNKIIILTYMFDRTLTFVPNEILSHVHFINADEFSSLLKIKDITENPSEIKEKPFAYKGITNPDSRLQKIFRDIACECGVEESSAVAMASMIENENHLNEMLMFTLLPYVAKVIGKTPYICSKRLQRYAGETGRCLKKDIIMRWFG